MRSLAKHCGDIRYVFPSNIVVGTCRPYPLPALSAPMQIVPNLARESGDIVPFLDYFCAATD